MGRPKSFQWKIWHSALLDKCPFMDFRHTLIYILRAIFPNESYLKLPMTVTHIVSNQLVPVSPKAPFLTPPKYIFSIILVFSFLHYSFYPQICRSLHTSLKFSYSKPTINNYLLFFGEYLFFGIRYYCQVGQLWNRGNCE